MILVGFASRLKEEQRVLIGEISEINEKLRTSNAGSIVRGGNEIDYSAMQQ